MRRSGREEPRPLSWGAAGKKAPGDGSRRAGPAIGFKPSSGVRRRRGSRQEPRPVHRHGLLALNTETGAYKGPLHTHGLRRARPPGHAKVSPAHPDYRVVASGIDVGAGWGNIGQVSGEKDVSLTWPIPTLARAPTRSIWVGRPARTTTASSP
ncbi:DUF736 family protein [Caulobacter sp. RL271]|uniref:DUF736 family protein n=1 Tax=Caulobacter segnis TaxID=88688 RepID=A0ABY4ZTD3_9CAUL|nr:DUF736 family protein [Caulobacter segnis]USQ95262.1 DUF736 family protein [Caulobacter segnis]